jgi:E3 ubiquitin-protein ligase RGLG
LKFSEYPLSIVLVGVGDGPWDTMKQFDDNIPSRAFDNFQVLSSFFLIDLLSASTEISYAFCYFLLLQFVNFTEIMLRNIPDSKREAEFALAALMEIPSQYKATMDLQLLGYSHLLSVILSS